MRINRRTFLGGAGVLSGFALGGEKSRLHAQQTDPTLTDPRIKITDVQPVRLRGQRGHQWFIIRVRTDQGIEGIGEGFLHGQYRAGAVDRFMALTKETAERLVGKNPLAINRFVREIKGRRTTDGLTWGTLIAMFEIAMWDILGQATGQPVHGLLGGKIRDRIPLYFNHGIWLTHTTDRAEKLRRIQRMYDRGFRTYKWSLRQREELEDLHGAFGDQLRLILEGPYDPSPEGITQMNQSWGEADNIVWWEHDYHAHPEDRTGHQFCLVDYPQLAAAVERSRLPIACGQYYWNLEDIQHLLATGVAVFQPEPGSIGGISQTVKAAAMAEACGAKIATHAYVGPLLTRVNAHINATLPNLYLQEYSGGAPEDAWAEDLLDPPNQIENGHIEVSDRPGLGCTFQEKLLEQWRAD